MQNKILNSSNEYLKVSNIEGAARETETYNGLPLGTSDGSANGELALKTVSVGAGSSGPTIPNYDYAVYTYIGSTNNISTIEYKVGGSGGTTVATRTFTYVNAGASDDDKIQTDTIS